MIGHYLSAYSPALSRRQLYDPDGTVIATSGSVTGGVNEGIAAAIATGFAFKCKPGGGTITCTGPLVIPACASADIDLGSTNFLFTGPASCALTMDSFNEGRFSHSGKLTFQGAPTAGNGIIRIAPSTPDPVDNLPFIQSSSIEFGTLKVVGVGVYAGVQIDCAAGSVINNKRLEWAMIDGWDLVANRMEFGIQVMPPNSLNNGFNENWVRVGQLLGFNTLGILVGLNQPNDLYLGDNDWEVGINPSGLATDAIQAAVSTYASYDCWRGAVTIYQGPCPDSIVFASRSSHNRWQMRQDTTPNGVQNVGTGNLAF